MGVLVKEDGRWPILSWSCMKGPCWKVVCGCPSRDRACLVGGARTRTGLVLVLDYHLGTELLRGYLNLVQDH